MTLVSVPPPAFAGIETRRLEGFAQGVVFVQRADVAAAVIVLNAVTAVGFLSDAVQVLMTLRIEIVGGGLLRIGALTNAHGILLFEEVEEMGCVPPPPATRPHDAPPSQCRFGTMGPGVIAALVGVVARAIKKLSELSPGMQRICFTSSISQFRL
ncbi:hypothetical protein [Caballeronia sp. LZ032]|uniref:hypothetical protein n=1 Tax=Caballeronia sp. LZ032 TaxID=3038565 RepID=UPI0028571858|nr:hypothetical protein [Caballeronia sp. LZ032]MDR5881619.1 hypothetical protein [Caballeronia sp. LZ032]